MNIWMMSRDDREGCEGKNQVGKKTGMDGMVEVDGGDDLDRMDELKADEFWA
ncbi:MAG TPA: hypothetical protein VFB72_10580 [Verrucomicrobiae bacterium]|nr:hypothetical protein [Verrucomicrobiae bacterium]